jgi:DNA repair exonuclease SbcCD nuclease subunit
VSYKLLHCADLHLDSPLRGLEADPEAPAALIRGATRQALTNLVDFAIAEGVAAVLIAGDLYDGDWQDWRTGQFLIAALTRLTRAGIRVVAISGNHDAESVITRRLRWPEGATMLPARRAETVSLEALNLHIHGRSFATREVVENLLPSYPARREGALNIGLLHTAATGRPGHASYAPCTPDQMAALGYDYWALGHIHTREIISKDPWIVFPGNLQGRHIRETGAKGATLITVTDGRIADVSHHALDVVRWAMIDIDATGAADEDAVLGRVRAAFAAAIAAAAPRLTAARLRLHGATAAHAALTAGMTALREKIHTEATHAGGADLLWLEEIRLDTRPAAVRAPATAMEGRLLARIAGPPAPATLDAMKAWAAALLEKVPPLAPALGADHPVTLMASGAVDEALLEEARAVLLARLGAA